jgi:phage I-like protein
MTYAAFGIHKTLIEQEGFDPNTEEYYTELDNRIRSEFSHKFSDNRKTNAPRVASAGNTASRSGAKKSRTVKLTPSQIAIAKRLGVPLEEYAKHVKE